MEVYGGVYILPIECPLIGLDEHMSSHSGYGPGTMDQGQKAAGAKAPAQQLLGLGPCSRLYIHYGQTYVHQGQSIGNQQAIYMPPYTSMRFHYA